MPAGTRCSHDLPTRSAPGRSSVELGPREEGAVPDRLGPDRAPRARSRRRGATAAEAPVTHPPVHPWVAEAANGVRFGVDLGPVPNGAASVIWLFGLRSGRDPSLVSHLGP